MYGFACKNNKKYWHHFNFHKYIGSHNFLLYFHLFLNATPGSNEMVLDPLLSDHVMMSKGTNVSPRKFGVGENGMGGGKKT